MVSNAQIVSSFKGSVQGNKKRFVSPDVYVVFGVPKRVRSTYLIWREGGKAPNIVFEITSRSTRREDTGTKMALYQNVLRVPEYFLFDPTGEYLRPHQLQGYRLENGIYHPISSLDGLLHSEQLGLDMWAEGNKLTLYDPVTAKTLRTPDQEGAYAQEQERIARIERRFAAEQERLAAEQKRIAEAQERIAKQQHLLAVKEMERAERAEAELARLQAELEALRKQDR